MQAERLSEVLFTYIERTLMRENYLTIKFKSLHTKVMHNKAQKPCNEVQVSTEVHFHVKDLCSIEDI